MTEISMDDIQRAGWIITLSRKIEFRMTALGATAAGLHEKTDQLAGKLSPECVKQLHFIGALRNRAAHEDVSVSAEDAEAFTAACETVIAELDRLIAQSKTAAPPLNVPAAPAATRPTEGEGGFPSPQLEPIPDVERELRVRICHFFDVCACVPIAHPLYLLWSLGRVFLGVLDDVMAILFGMLGIIVIIEGIRISDPNYWKLGIFLLIGIYFYALVIGFVNENCRRHSLWLRLMPLLNNAVFLERGLKKLRVLELLFTSAALGAIVYGTIQLTQKNFQTGLIALFGSYLGALMILLLDKFHYSSDRKSSNTSKFQSR